MTATNTLAQPAAQSGRRYRIGVIGCGARGETFARQLNSGLARAELAGVCDLDADRMGRFVEFCGLTGTRQFTDPQAFLADKQVDGIVITTPEFTHADIAVQALALGKHVYMEKPLAHTLADCNRIIDAADRSSAVVMMGFNLRMIPVYNKLYEVIRSGVLGQLVHVSGLEQLSIAHGASFMRRWHRRASRSGGLLNTKCSHDLDIIQWLVGHEHRITRLSSFGGSSVFGAKTAPAPRCSQCPDDIRSKCAYRDRPGFVFPISGPQSFHKTRDVEIYGNDLCVYSADKDIVDNQTIIMEWDNGLRGNFNLQMFSNCGMRQMQIWGERARAILTNNDQPQLEVIDGTTGDRSLYQFIPRKGGHGGADSVLMNTFIDRVEGREKAEASLLDGLAATLVALKADESRLSGQTVRIDPREYRR